MNIEISKVIPYGKNTKTHTRKQISQVADSIKRFGFIQPLVLSKNNEVVIGHCRLEAAKLLGLEEVPYISVENLSDKEVKALRLADNKLNESQWDMDLVIEELKSLEDDALLALTGFTKDLITGVQEDNFDAQAEYDKINQPRAELGQIWALGSHRLMCGDSTKEDDVAKVMNGELADMIWTDPPYNVDYNYTSKYEGIRKEGKNRTKLSKQQIFNDKKSPQDFYKFLLDVFNLCYKFSKPSMAMYCCHATKTQEQFFSALKEAGYHFSQTIIWLKERIILALGQDYHRVYEPVWFGWKEKQIHYKNKELTKEKEFWDLDRMNFEERLDVWHLRRDKSSDYIHPTQKPVRLPERAIKKSSQKGGVLYEPFNGSGSTMMACEQMDRKCYAIELDPKFIDVAIERWEKWTGQKAIKVL